MSVEFTRRRLLGSVGTVGAAAVAGVNVLASDAVAYSSSTTVGASPVVRVDWVETYNGRVLDSGDETADGPVIDVGDAQPGDSGTVAFRVTPESNEAARVAMSLGVTGNAENGQNEPEAKSGDSTLDVGELGDFLAVAVWYDTGMFGVSGLGGCDGVRDPGETTVAEGSLLDVDAALADGVYLGGDCLPADESVCVGVSWGISAGAGNTIQGDGVEAALSFTVESCQGGT